jgi:hypothetical protein
VLPWHVCMQECCTVCSKLVVVEQLPAAGSAAHWISIFAAVCGCLHHMLQLQCIAVCCRVSQLSTWGTLVDRADMVRPSYGKENR